MQEQAKNSFVDESRASENRYKQKQWPRGNFVSLSLSPMFLLFDSYGTLLELDDFYSRLQRGFAAFDVHLPPDVVKRAAHREMHHYMKGAKGATDFDSWNALRAECAHILADAIRQQNHVLELPCEALVKVLSDAVVYKPFPGTREVLAELQTRDVQMGVVSNWDFRLKCALDEAELAPFFDFVLSSAEAGFEKPSPEIFAQGLEFARRRKPELQARDCFYIGDHYEKDVLGARSVGMSPLWLVRDARDVASGQTHDAAHDDVPRLRSLEDLLRMF